MPTKADADFGPWNPGIGSTIPERLMPRVTLYDPRYSFVSWAEARDLADITGLKPQDLAVTRPERLALHSVLIRVTGQLFVPDGPKYADLGIHLRTMAATIYDGYVVPEMDRVRAAFEAVRAEARAEIETLLASEIYKSDAASPASGGLLSRMFGKTDSGPPPDPTANALKASEAWKDERNEDIPSACKRALGRTLGAILNRRGSLLVDREIIARVAEGFVLNRLGATAVGRAVSAILDKAVEAEGYRRLPGQADPVILNAKGASASGKSTIRGEQRRIAERLGLDWRDFAIISPDYWRKALIDYEALGDDHKYGAMLTGQELEVIDRKFDILMAVSGQKGNVPHMLIDRFRFDSFVPDRLRGGTSTLLTRFGSRVYLFFLITPPQATVERAWQRGLETGRFKAVDDLLYHNIEAYSGIPDLFFGWAKGRVKWVHYEFLDNSVDRGEPPRSVAYGKNGTLVIRDVERLCDIARFRHVNVDARGPDEVLKRELDSDEAMVFVRRAVTELDRVVFLTPGGDGIFAVSDHGRLEVDESRLPPGFDPSALGDYQNATAGFDPLPEGHADDVIGV